MTFPQYEHRSSPTHKMRLVCVMQNLPPIAYIKTFGALLEN